MKILNLVNLKRLLKKDIISIIKEICNGVEIKDASGNILLGSKIGNTIGSGAEITGLDKEKAGVDPEKLSFEKDDPKLYGRFPVYFHDQIIGWVSGGAGALSVAKLLAYQAQLEEEKKLLAKETLEKYKEINLLYNLTEKLSQKPDAQEIAGLVLKEAKKTIKADSMAILLANEANDRIEVIAAYGSIQEQDPVLFDGEGLVESIRLTGRAEIINEVAADPRYFALNPLFKSIMYAPLKIKDNIIGIFILGSQEKILNYTAEDLKMLNVLSSQAAFALENIRLNFILETFGRYLSDDLVKQLLTTPGALNLGGEKKLITILLSDLRGFTSLAEKLSPETVVSIINNYLKAMVDVIQKYNGTILEFIGDAVMVIFGAPIATKDHAALAVACALEMQLAMASVNQWNQENGIPVIQMGIGVNTGQVIVGNIGSEKRTKYGCVGSQVNLTGRIEAYTLGGQILISQETLLALKSLKVEIKERLCVRPKGFKEPIIVFDVTGMGEPYSLYLPQSKPELISLVEVIPVKIYLIEDKYCQDTGFDGVITGLSLSDVPEIEISPAQKILVPADLKLQILAMDGEVWFDEVYGKVKAVETDEANKHYCLVQLTVIPQQGKEYLQNLVNGKL